MPVFPFSTVTTFLPASMNVWKQKLADYLHDPPSKVLEIRDHKERSRAAYRQAGFIDSEIGRYLSDADHTAAAADRLPFPNSRESGLQCKFDGVRNAFRHPLGGQSLPFTSEFITVEQGFEAESTTQPILSEASLADLPDDNERDRARFFAHWRLWQRNATIKDYRFAFLPSDTRIPDHTVWNHMQVVSALGTCTGTGGKLAPAFLKFQLGPVQDFIAAARSTRDLWSGSYLLSWLMAAGLKTLSAQVGPDAIIFPNLRDQSLFDLHWRDELWSKIRISDQQPLWESLDWNPDDFQVANLPNVFLALVPADQGPGLARQVETAIRDEWKRIADAVWTFCQEAALTADEGSDGETMSESERRNRFDSQVSRFLTLTWQVTPWPETMEEAIAQTNDFGAKTPVKIAVERVQRVLKMAEKEMHKSHRDARYYDCPQVPPGQARAGWKDKSKLTDDARLDNVGLAWSVVLGINGWQLDAVRQTRAFEAAHIGGWEVGTFNNKDALTGKDEAVAGGREWALRVMKAGRPLLHRFKTTDWLGATSLIKRLWDLAYLEPQWGLDIPRFPHTRGIASGDSECKHPENDEDDSVDFEELGSSDKYFAVLAFDGDEIGKWVSGEKTPPFSTQLADYWDDSDTLKFGAKAYFERPEFCEEGEAESFLNAQRPLSPSYHLQFSEALGNFAGFCARPIVKAYHGRLIYSGGDDVVALLPADKAIACGEALRTAFQGREVRGPDGTLLFGSPEDGFLTETTYLDDSNCLIPFLVPCPKADASVGIAMAHFKSPLQDVVRAAQAAEKRAKKKLHRSAVAVTLMKRSGEIVEWGTKWEGGLQLHHALIKALTDKSLSSRFPHRFAELLEPYLSGVTPLIEAQGSARSKSTGGTVFPVTEVILTEFRHCLSRQRGTEFPKSKSEADQLEKDLEAALEKYLKTISPAPSNKSLSAERPCAPDAHLASVVGLCQTIAFAHRTADESEPKGRP